jgi:hypothetical protein
MISKVEDPCPFAVNVTAERQSVKIRKTERLDLMMERMWAKLAENDIFDQ